MVTAEEPLNFSGRAAGGIFWTTAQKWFSRIGGLLTLTILARLLEPSDFGMLAIAMSIIPLLHLLADLGFTAYLVQVENPKDEDYCTAFWFSFSAGIFLAFVFGIAGYPLKVLLGEAEVVPIMWALAPTVVLVAASSVPNAMLHRSFRFDVLARQSMIAGSVGQVLAIVMALKGFGVWSLIAQMLMTQLVGTFLVWRSVSWAPSRVFSVSEFRRMTRYGSNVVAVELIALGRAWAENSIVAAVLGLNGLGYLSVAQRLILSAQDMTTTAVTPVSMVVFAQVRTNSERLLSVYERAQAVAYALVIPVMVFIAVSAPAIVPMIFGSQWTTSIVPAQALAIAGILTTGASLDHGLMYGLGRPGTWFVYAVVIDAITVAMTWFMAPRGIDAIAAGFVVVALFATVVRLPVVGHQLGVSWKRSAAQFARAVLLAIAIGVVGTTTYIAANDYGRIAALLVTGTAISLSWLAIVHYLFPSVRGELKRFAQAILGRMRPTLANLRFSTIRGGR